MKDYYSTKGLDMTPIHRHKKTYSCNQGLMNRFFRMTMTAIYSA